MTRLLGLSILMFAIAAGVVWQHEASSLPANSEPIMVAAPDHHLATLSGLQATPKLCTPLSGSVCTHTAPAEDGCTNAECDTNEDCIFYWTSPMKHDQCLPGGQQCDEYADIPCVSYGEGICVWLEDQCSCGTIEIKDSTEKRVRCEPQP